MSQLRAQRPPTVRSLDRYVLVRELGAGGMGTVHLAFDPRLERNVALKVLKDPDADAGTGTDTRSLAEHRLVVEGKAMARIRHPNVVAVYDVGNCGGQVFLACEFVDGGTLRDWLHASAGSRRGRTWTESLDIVLDAGRGLAAAHDEGMTHRDFKPDNVLLSASGEVKVTDFGLVKLRGEAANVGVASSRQASERPLTESSASWHTVGPGSGTPAYMAPEQFDGQPADERSDMYSFCLTAYELIHGARPFAGTSSSRHARSAGGLQPRPTSLDPRVPRWLTDCLLSGMHVDPRRRPESIRDLLAQLEAKRREQGRMRGLELSIAAVLVACIAAWMLISHRLEALHRPCELASRQLEQIWNPDMAAEIRQAFGTSMPTFGAQTFRRVGRGLDDYARDWSIAYGDACRAGSETSSELDLRMRCLGARRDSLEALTREFLTGGSKTLRHAVRAVDALPRIEDCADPRAYRETLRLPDDPETRAAVLAIEAEILQVETAMFSGNPRALDRARELADRARSLDHLPLRVRTRLLESRAPMEIDPSHAHVDTTDALTRWRSTEVLARASGDMATVAMALSQQMYLRGYLDAKHEEGFELARRTRSALVAAGHPREATGQYFNTLGILLGLEDHYDAAEDAFERGLAAFREAFGPDHIDTIRSYSNLAWISYYKGNYPASVAYYERAIELQRSKFGTKHPMLAQYHSSLVHARLRAGDVWGAVRAAELAYEGCSERPQSTDRIEAMHALESAYGHAGEYARAIPILEGLRAWEHETGRRSSPYALWSDSCRARIDVSAGRWDTGLLHAKSGYDRLIAEGDAIAIARLDAATVYARALRESGRGPEAAALLLDNPPGRAKEEAPGWWLELARAHLSSGQYEDAARALTSALATKGAGTSSKSSEMAEYQLTRARLELHRDNPRAAVVEATRALEGRQSTYGSDSHLHLDAWILRGRAYLALGRGTAAMRDFERARAALQSAPLEAHLSAEVFHGLARAHRLTNTPEPSGATSYLERARALLHDRSRRLGASRGVVDQWMLDPLPDPRPLPVAHCSWASVAPCIDLSLAPASPANLVSP